MGIDFLVFGADVTSGHDNFRVIDLYLGKSSPNFLLVLSRIFMYFFRSRGQVPVFITYFWSHWSWLATSTYKALNPRDAFSLNKLDGNPRRMKQALEVTPKRLGREKLLELIVSRYLKSVDVISCESEALRQVMLSSGRVLEYAHKVCVIPSGVSTEFLDACAKLTDQKRVESAELKILFLGRLNEPFKGLQVLLEAIPLVSVPASFTICGPQGNWSRGMLTDFFEHNNAAQSRVRILDPVRGPEAVARLMAKHDVLCLPSFDTEEAVESFGLVLVEAIASGVYVIAADSVPSAEDILVKPFGQTFESKNSKDLAASVNLVSRTPGVLDRVREDGLRWVRESYNWDALVRQYYEARARSSQGGFVA